MQENGVIIGPLSTTNVLSSQGQTRNTTICNLTVIAIEQHPRGPGIFEKQESSGTGALSFHLFDNSDKISMKFISQIPTVNRIAQPIAGKVLMMRWPRRII